ncbi:hypothetical protein DRJ27_02500, partial [Candidatus Acetothermia bacterium]
VGAAQKIPPRDLPLHHHLEEGEVPWRYLLRSPNWPEPVVVVRLWLLSLGFVILGLLATNL